MKQLHRAVAFPKDAPQVPDFSFLVNGHGLKVCTADLGELDSQVVIVEHVQLIAWTLLSVESSLGLAAIWAIH